MVEAGAEEEAGRCQSLPTVVGTYLISAVAHNEYVFEYKLATHLCSDLTVKIKATWLLTTSFPCLLVRTKDQALEETPKTQSAVR